MTLAPTLFTHAQTARLDSDRQLRRMRERGEYVRIATGVYARASEWSALDSDARYRAFVRAQALRSRPAAQFSHDSAAALWRLPTIGPWPSMTHEVVDPVVGGTSRTRIRRHALGRDPNGRLIDGVNVTSLPRTAVDMACTTTFARAVAMVDAARRAPARGERTWGREPATAQELELELVAAKGRPGAVRASRVIAFSTDKSGSVGESFARVQFHALGLPAPELQVEFSDERGSIGFADFFWPEIGLIGEFDGLSKYGARRLFQQNLSLEEIVMREKRREDRMRRVSDGFARIGWDLASDRAALALELRRHGLVPVRRPRV